jgi:Fur family peroxide stress response transcriptional regulator
MQNGNKNDALIIQALRSKGYKATPQRIAVCRIALNNKEHPNVEKIYTEVKKIYSTVSLATVYKTLHILKENQLIQELNMPQGETRIDPNTAPHVNLVCNRCGRIQDFTTPDLKKHIQNVIMDTKFVSDTLKVEVYGLCEMCSKKTMKD